ncbi:sensor histidine kinase [Streptomyces sp. NPDC090085]|uniref:sensor histidine kinase n=1 Tax=Streptomyces sp. NPDC090085 TaxID=3365943 RepID=UPI003816AF8B
MPEPGADRAAAAAVLPDGGGGTRGQWVVTLAVTAVGIATIRPMGFGGQGLLVAVLFVVNVAVLAVRVVPEQRLPGLLVDRRFRTVWAAFAVVAAAALIAAADTGSSYLFAFFLVGLIGSRFDTRSALALAALSSLLCAGALYLRAGPDERTAATLLGLATGAAVLAGMAGRSRAEATRAALEAAESAGKAARAEARTAVLAERTRIARDVHDVLAHSLAGINMQLELVDALIDTGDLERIRAANGTAHDLVRESLKQAQWTVHSLREDSLPLVESLTAMLESSGHHDALTVEGEAGPLPVRVTQGILRVAQEALTNAARHAPGAEVTVRLDCTGGAAVLTVRNGPPALPVAAVPGSGLGLVGMRERVALLGGSVTTGPVTEGPDRGGWQVRAEVPR